MGTPDSPKSPTSRFFVHLDHPVRPVRLTRRSSSRQPELSRIVEGGTGMVETHQSCRRCVAPLPVLPTISARDRARRRTESTYTVKRPAVARLAQHPVKAPALGAAELAVGVVHLNHAAVIDAGQHNVMANSGEIAGAHGADHRCARLKRRGYRLHIRRDGASRQCLNPKHRAS